VVTRIVATAIVLILGFAAFWLGPLDVARMLNPLDVVVMLFMGIVWLLFAGIVWFKWDSLRDAFQQGRTSYLPLGERRGRSGPPINRSGANELRGIIISQQPRSRCSASPNQ